MEFINKIHDLAEKALDLRSELRTEEATKTALILPFISLLGYDIFSPREVVPEFTADVGTKKGERVDYAILKDGQPIILIECKTCDRNLASEHASQLYRYFSVVNARFGILTNGLAYRFFTDLDAPNRMDEKPFLEFDLMEIKESLINELKKFSKPAFDVDGILSTASELKYMREIKQILAAEYEQPSGDFTRFFLNQFYSGLKTQSVLNQFQATVKRAFYQFVNDRLNDRLKSALHEEIPSEQHVADLGDQENQAEKTQAEGPDESAIITSEEELRAFYIVKAVLHGTVDLKRVAMRDRISYCGVLLDDNNRKPICRLHFNTAQKYLGVFNPQREEERIAIANIEEIYKYAERLRSTAQGYDSPTEVSE